ncbi:MAG: hypothetical protein ABJC89_09315 [Acidobacteriota bacterium]
MDLSGQPAGATVICTLGMHRSGTSLVARMLSLLGVALGPDERVVTAGDDNPKGYWEHRRIVDLNDEILAAFGGRWDQPPEFPPSWPRDARLADLRARAGRLLAEDFAAEPLWGWKDPRTCLTLPFWQDLAGPMQYVVCVRNPCAVVASLTRRNAMSGERAERLWLAHAQAAIAQTSGRPRMFVGYEEILEDWEQALRRMAAFIGHPERAEAPGTRAAVEEFLEPAMCHHHMTTADLVVDPRISFATKGFYVGVKAHAEARRAPGADAAAPGRAAGGADRALELLGAQALEAFDQIAAAAAERDALARDVQAFLAERVNLTREYQALLEERVNSARAYEALSAAQVTLTGEYDVLSGAHQDLSRAYQVLLADRDAFAVRHAALIAERDRLAGEHQAVIVAHETLGQEHQAVITARDTITGWYEGLAAERGDVTREYQALLADRDAIRIQYRAAIDERDVLARHTETQSAALDAAGADRDRLAAESAVLARHCGELGIREEQERQAIAALQSDVRALTIDRDAQARARVAAVATLEEVQTSSAWRLVTVSRQVIARSLPAGTRRGRLFTALVHRIAKRLPARARGSVADAGAV